MDFLSASRGFDETTALMQAGKNYTVYPAFTRCLYCLEYISRWFFHFVAGYPFINHCLITALIYRGMKKGREMLE
jgi:hypothetical protein